MLVAYIDPAVGSMLLQAIAAIGLAGAVVCRRLLLAPLAWFGHSNLNTQDLETGSSTDND
jgi:hypothetical protein